MARKKAVKSKESTVSQSSNVGSGILDYFRFGDSYTSLLLGMVVVILAVILIAALFRDRNLTDNNDVKRDISATKTGPEAIAPRAGASYTVREGDTLWSISEQAYKSGYNWGHIAAANNLSSPDMVEAGMKLQIPESPTKAPVVSEPTVVEEQQQTGSEIKNDTSYTIRRGDTLWDISVKVYGDGYKWPQIAAHNKIPDPNLIYIGNTITFPRL